jgi:hypothetical protein
MKPLSQGAAVSQISCPAKPGEAFTALMSIP